MYLDISSIKDESLGGRRHWAMLVDEAARCKHSFFLKKKSDQVDMVSSWLKGLKDKYNIQVKLFVVIMLEKTRNLKKNVMQTDWALSLNTQQQGPLNRRHLWKGPFRCLWEEPEQ